MSIDATSNGQPSIPAGSIWTLIAPLQARWRLLTMGPLFAAALGAGGSYLITPTFTAAALVMPPQQQSSTALVMANLGALGGLAGSAGNLRTPADQFLALMASTSARDRLIDRFDLKTVYSTRLRVEARDKLDRNTRMFVGKKDGLITVEVDDVSPKRAADLVNAYVDELRRLLSVLAITEAQQRRLFFEGQMRATREALTTAQRALQASGFNSSALRAEPRAASDSYARLRAEATATEVRLQTLRRGLAESSTEVQQAQTTLSALRSQIEKLERGLEGQESADYIGRYREFKYQETLFELISRQYELARVDESRDGALIQVIDAAQPPERKSGPRRALITVWAMIGSFVVLTLWLLAIDGRARTRLKAAGDSRHPAGNGAPAGR